MKDLTTKFESRLREAQQRNKELRIMMDMVKVGQDAEKKLNSNPQSCSGCRGPGF